MANNRYKKPPIIKEKKAQTTREDTNHTDDEDNICLLYDTDNIFLDGWYADNFAKEIPEHATNSLYDQPPSIFYPLPDSHFSIVSEPDQAISATDHPKPSLRKYKFHEYIPQTAQSSQFIFHNEYADQFLSNNKSVQPENSKPIVSRETTKNKWTIIIDVRDSKKGGKKIKKIPSAPNHAKKEASVIEKSKVVPPDTLRKRDYRYSDKSKVKSIDKRNAYSVGDQVFALMGKKFFGTKKVDFFNPSISQKKIIQFWEI